MIATESLPSPNDPVEHHADFLELSVFKATTASFSVRDYIRDLKLSSANEVIAEEEPDESGEDQTEPFADAVFAELDERKQSCGEANHYPFVITSNTLKLRKKGEESLYAFLALLSWYGKDAGPAGTDGEKLFEEICAQAVEVYLGGPNSTVRSVVFGFPRRVGPPGFAQALDHLCKELREGGGHHKGRPKLPDEKDGKLDIVAWKEFPDKRQGKLITFGQCATGNNWDKKVNELPPPDRWCGHWMAETLTVLPVRSFFVPHRVEEHRWSYTCTFGGVFYDRCRITSLASAADTAMKKSWADWSSHVLKWIRKS